MDDTVIVYYARNKVNGKGYVGKTTYSLQERLDAHLKDARKGCKYLFHRAIRKYGWDAFEVSVVEECQSEDELNLAEIAWIAKLQTYCHKHPDKGYNMTLGGEGFRGIVFSAETRKVMSEKATKAGGWKRVPKEINDRRIENMKGEGNCNFGKAWGKLSWTPEEAAVVREKNLANPKCHQKHSEENKKIIADDSSKRRKLAIAVEQLAPNGDVVCVYRSLSAAAQSVGGFGIPIKRCCEGDGLKTYLGFGWRYVKKPERTLIAACDRGTGEVLAVYNLVTDAAQKLGCTKNKISEVLCGRRQTHHGYKWRYVTFDDAVKAGWVTVSGDLLLTLEIGEDGKLRGKG